MIETSKTLRSKVSHLHERMRAANVSVEEMQAFERVADVLKDSHGIIEGDNLIALSFVTSDEL